MRVQKVVLTNRNGTSSPSGDGILSSYVNLLFVSDSVCPLYAMFAIVIKLLQRRPCVQCLKKLR